MPRKVEGNSTDKLLAQ